MIDTNATALELDRRFVPARDNPFSIQRVTRIPYRFETGSWQSHLESLDLLCYRAAIVGPRGSGKTTLLSELAARIDTQTSQRAEYFFLPRERQGQNAMLRSALHSAAAARVMLVDGIDRVSFARRLRFFRASSGMKLVVTAHRSLRLPPLRLPTWIRTTTSCQLLDHVLLELNVSNPLVHTAARKSLLKFRGNLRNVLRELYDTHADLK